MINIKQYNSELNLTEAEQLKTVDSDKNNKELTSASILIQK